MEGTVYGYRTDDNDTLVADYPLLPSTRKFWNKMLQVIDTAGTSGQLRNQLRIIDDSLKSVAELEIGQIVPADFIFNQNQTQLIQSGLLLNETSTLIQERKAKGGDSTLEGRILSAVFLLDKLTTDIPNTGLKCNEQFIADLLIDNLNTSSDTFRSKIKTLIKKLIEEKVLMPISDEYKLQTKIGQEWEQEFTKQYVKLNNSGDDQIQGLRKTKILSFFKDKTKGIVVTQGIAKQGREFELWDKETLPNTEHKLNVWIRDGWFENENTVLNEIRAAGSDTPLAYVFVKKFRDPELRTEILKFLAAGLTLDAKGLPSTQDGEKAKKSMETRQANAKTEIEALIEKICSESLVYYAGGNSVQKGAIKENIEEVLSGIADRQFPDYKSKADFANWGQVLNKAIAGNPDALNAIHFMGDVATHPVATEILRFIGNSTKQGKEIRNHFWKSPYGWSQDAIDAILILLKNTQHISTSEPNLIVSRINNATFKKEIHILGVKDKLSIKGLFQKAGISCPPNQEIFPFSNMFLEKLKTLALQVGGDAPRPDPIKIDFIKDIENKEGNERLLDILEQQTALQAAYDEWSAKATLVSTREPLWDLLIELTNHAPDDADFDQFKDEVKAIRENRLLLQEPDPIQPKLNDISDKLKTLLNKLKENYIKEYDEKMAELQANQYFAKLTPEQKHHILGKHQLLAKPELKPLDAQALSYQLQKLPLYGWDTKIAALSGQFHSAVDEAITLSAPKAKTFNIPRRTITNQVEIDAYVAELKTELENLLKESSSIILR